MRLPGLKINVGGFQLTGIKHKISVRWFCVHVALLDERGGDQGSQRGSSAHLGAQRQARKEHVLIVYPYRASCGAASLLCFHSGLLCLAPFLSTEHSPPLLQNPLLYFISLFSTRSGQRAKE